MTLIATWNVNSIKARLPSVTEWLEAFKPDVALLQELKTEDAGFPRLEIETLGYHVETVGQKTYNGVAILSKQPIAVTARRLSGEDTDEQARYIEGDTCGVRVASIYLPNGNPTRDEGGADSEKYLYKLRWMDRLAERARQLLKTRLPFVLGGDYNICPTDDDVYDAAAFADDALCRPESRRRFRILLNLGLTEAFRALDTTPHAYSYWDYQKGAWQKDNGLRIDHLLLSPEAADKLSQVGIDKTPRGKDKASDHTPVWIKLD
ncbi:MAG: exodeoxyribonuclease III [Proteobacteria bacterium]|nr:exodeoxyribonuclease III [Pseudomonadota bacterium]